MDAGLFRVARWLLVAARVPCIDLLERSVDTECTGVDDPTSSATVGLGVPVMVDTAKPTTLKEYRKWLAEKHGVRRLRRQQTYYESVQSKVLTDFEQSASWSQLGQRLKDINSEYYSLSDYQLFAERAELPPLHAKPFDSFLLKTFRKNVLENEDWPSPPGDNWILPDNWFSRINDIVRTVFVVKYLDGVHFLVSKIRTLFDEHGLPCEAHLEARPEGYYAAHLCVSCEFEIPAWRWDTVRTRVAVELQITTQVQDLIRRLLHRHYERRRSKPTPDVITWQWDYKSAEFVPNYLGHILHYVEGMIMEVREGRSERRRA